MSDKIRNKEQITGRIVFTFKNDVVQVIDLNEASLKPEKKVKIVEDALNKIVKDKGISDKEKFNITIYTERFPPSTFLSSTHTLESVSK